MTGPASRIATFVCRWTLAGLALLPVAPPAWAGSIKGIVQLAGGTVEQKRLAVTIDQHVCGRDKEPETLVLSAQKGIRNAVVWIDAPAQARVDAPAVPVQV